MNINALEKLLTTEMEAIKGGTGEACQCMNGGANQVAVACICNTAANQQTNLEKPCAQTGKQA